MKEQYGQIRKVDVISTRRGTPMAFLEVEVSGGQEVKTVVFPDVYEKFGAIVHQAFEHSRYVGLLVTDNIGEDGQLTWIAEEIEIL